MTGHRLMFFQAEGLVYAHAIPSQVLRPYATAGLNSFLGLYNS